MSTGTKDLLPACKALSVALNELLAATETIVGEMDLGGETVYVRANLDKAANALGELAAYLQEVSPD
jgi:hypothetical protein